MDLSYHQTNKTNSWFAKFAESFFAAIAILTTSWMLAGLIFEELDNYQGFFFLGVIALSLLLAIIFTIYWNKKEKKQVYKSAMIHAWFRGILRYWLAFQISTYGFAKILGTQFGTAFYRDDTPVSQLSGFELTWNYFAHSYILAVIIALLQIGGSLLLLFRRTTLLGVAILLPVMLNIVLINVFYQIGNGAFINSVLFSLGLLYLLFLRWNDLKSVFLRKTVNLPDIYFPVWKNIARVLVFVIPFFYVYYLSIHYGNPSDKSYVGKWKIDKLSRNNIPLAEDGWLKDSTVWKNIYIEEIGYAAFSPNPYIFDKRSTWVKYNYDKNKKIFKIMTRDQNKKIDTINVLISHANASSMQWNMILGKDTMELHLSKEMKKMD